MTELTRRQADALGLIRESIATRGFPPTTRELCNGLGLSPNSYQGVHEHLQALERKGFIERLPLLSRGIRLTLKGQPAPKRCRDRETDPGSVDEGEVT